VRFVRHAPASELRALYRGARALLQPGHEDFGIAVVEALACGRPVVALARGGALEIVEDGVTGVLVDDRTPEAFADGMARLDALTFASDTLRQQALRFSRERFDEAVRRLLQVMWTGAPC
jgi:hypothetical protein